MKRSPLKRHTPLSRAQSLRTEGQTKAKKRAKYKAFLSSAKWKQLRREAISRAREVAIQKYGYEGAHPDCAICDRAIWNEDIHVDHKTYVRFAGDERPSDLQVVHRDCHRRKHGAQWWKR